MQSPPLSRQTLKLQNPKSLFWSNSHQNCSEAQAEARCSSPGHWAAAYPHSLVFPPWLSCWEGQCHENQEYSGQLWVNLRGSCCWHAQQLQEPNHQPLVRQQPWCPKSLVASRGFQLWWLWKRRTGATTTHEMTGDKQLRLLSTITARK